MILDDAERQHTPESRYSHDDEPRESTATAHCVATLEAHAYKRETY